MGYSMYQADSSVVIKEENEFGLVVAVREFFSKNEELAPRYIIEYFEDAFDAWGLEVDLDEDGNVKNLYFNTSHSSGNDDTRFFEAIAPFVEPSSYIHMLGEDADQWRWFFHDGKVEVQSIKEIIWE